METVKMSSKGQIVIPQNIREEIGAIEGSIFVVANDKDSVILKKIETPSKEELIKSIKNIALRGEERAQKIGIKEKDIQEIIHNARKRKDKS